MLALTWMCGFRLESGFREGPYRHFMAEGFVTGRVTGLKSK